MSKPRKKDGLYVHSSVWTPQNKKEVIEMFHKGASIVEVCRFLGINKSTWYRWLKDPRKKDFRDPSTGARARRTLQNTYLCMLSEGARAPAGAAAAKKEAPSGTHESLGLFEHGRPRKFARRSCDFLLRTRTGSHAYAYFGSLFRHI